MEEKEWLILNYILPKKPSRVRVSIWRKLKKHNSVNIGHAMWVLPLTEENIELFKEISNEIFQNNGEAYIMKSSFIDEKSTNSIIETFNKVRDND
ncbi:Chromate resistance protein ChrB [Anaerosacchariphilus polymeriproducens]|uniref:ChrB N-terminal domain-containing protein n=1 Tax=Anaerosacchariphilus polymeriproducens TaxID=1812858 RepID=A0A371ASU1_9FIRM|nr:Chromate resistance protein ChrB [Anaerosacchariphilus polymeriproducens]RDU22646.1 hypothetical protein DWV06_15360 [Anaerosacchariphilus polymeriproducens]